MRHRVGRCASATTGPLPLPCPTLRTVSRPTTGARGPAAADVALARTYRRHAETVAGTSPLTAHVALALSRSDPAMRLVGTAPARARHPAPVLASLHDAALAGSAPALTAAYAAGDGDAAAEAALDTLLRLGGPVMAMAAHRRTRTDEPGPHAVLHPAVAAAAHRVGATAVGLVDVGCSAALDLNVDRVGISYDDGRSRGDPSSPVQVSAAVVGRGHVPGRELPDVVVRIGVDRDPVDVTDADDVRWLRACLGPDQPHLRARLDAEIALAASSPVHLLDADPVDGLPDALARVPADALPVVITTWALSRFSPGARLRFVHRLDEASLDRPVAWVSVEGVGVAPAVPTLGDRRASGHSTIGVTVLDGSVVRAEAVGRCWSRGGRLAWLAPS